MSEIQRLLRVAARRNEAGEYGSIRVRLLKAEIEALRETLSADSMSLNVLFEAVVRGYINRHPAVLAMVDQWKRDERPSDPEQKSLRSREIADIYAELAGDNIDGED